MNTLHARFIEPLDVLILRGNKLFGDPGSYGESLIPPWPSVAAGAIRSRMLVDDNIDLAAFGRNEIEHPVLGTPRQPGTFTIAAFHLARRTEQGIEILVAPPADLVISESAKEQLEISALAPQAISGSLQTSATLPYLPVLVQGNRRSKSLSGYWLNQSGWHHYLRGETPTAAQLVHSSTLWSTDARLGIGMSAATRSVEEGKLFSTQAIALKSNLGFVALVSGAQPPEGGLLRFGGDGRAATIQSANIAQPEPDYAAIAKAGRCRIVLTTPGLFEAGWLPNGITQDAEGGYRFALQGVQGRLACAAVPRAEVISGWDLAEKAPKAAQRGAPAGSLYWLDELEATPDALGKLVEQGLWSEGCEDGVRRAEGFNRIAIGAWR